MPWRIRRDELQERVSPVHEAQVMVTNVPGIHARPAALLVQKASGFAAEIFLTNGQLTVNAKSIMGVMMLAAETGTELTVRAEGSDEQGAVTALVELIESEFKE